MAWVYDRTGSLLIAVLMHASLTTSMVLLAPPVAGSGAVVYDLVFGAALWVLVGIGALWSRQWTVYQVMPTRSGAQATRPLAKESTQMPQI